MKFKMPALRPARHGERGVGILEVMVASAILVAIVAGVGKFVSDAFKSKATLKAMLDREAIRTLVIQGISCAKTFPSGTCASGTYVPVLNKKGTVFVAASGTPMGNWTVRAQCTASGVSVRVAQLKSSPPANASNFDHNVASSFLNDPSLKIPFGWAHPQSELFPMTSSPCILNSGAAPTAQTCSVGEWMNGLDSDGAPIGTALPVFTPSAACVSLGGTWDGSRCAMASATPPLACAWSYQVAPSGSPACPPGMAPIPGEPVVGGFPLEIGAGGPGNLRLCCSVSP